MARGYVVISLETSKTEQKKGAKVPDACALVGVKCAKVKAILPCLHLR